MQVSVENIGKLERRMQVQVPAEQVSKEIAARLKHISRTARLNGFRPGKAPLNVIRRQFGPQVHREVIGELLQSSYEQAVTQNALAPAGSPRIEPQSIDEGQDLKYTATFEVYPEVVMQPIESLQIERITAEVAETDVDAMIERLRQQQIKYVEAARPATLKDKVTVDFEGSVEGVPFAGGKGENIEIVLGEGRMLAQLEAGLIGSTVGDKRSITVNFPADYRATELAGKEAVFATETKKVEAPTLPELDEEFCKAFGVAEGGIPKLREDVVANMRRELAANLRNRNKSVVMDKLYGLNPIDIPNVLLESQIRDMQAEAMRRAGVKDASQAPPREPYVEPARRRVALGLLLNDIIRREKLIVDRARVDERLDELVSAYGDAAAMKRAYMANPDAMRQVESLTLEDQAVDWVLAHAKVQDKPSTFKEVMNFEA
jgi:trigger factor